MGGRGLERFKLKTWQCDEISVRRSMNFLADDPTNFKIAALGKVCLKGLLGQRAHCQERWCGQVTSRILRQPALAPALAVKIDAAPFQKTLSQTS